MILPNIAALPPPGKYITLIIVTAPPITEQKRDNRIVKNINRIIQHKVSGLLLVEQFLCPHLTTDFRQFGR